MFLKQIGLNLNVDSKSLMSSIMSISSMNLNVFCENGNSAYLQESHAKSKEQIARLSGIHRPWSMGTRALTFLPVLLLILFLTKMLHSFLSRFSILKSKMAILWTSSLWKRSGEKFSIGPSLSTQYCSEPNFIPIQFS